MIFFLASWKIILEGGKVILGGAKIILVSGKIILEGAKLFWDVQQLFWQLGKFILDVQKLFWQVGRFIWEVQNYFGKWENYFGTKRCPQTVWSKKVSHVGSRMTFYMFRCRMLYGKALPRNSITVAIMYNDFAH